MSYPLLLHGQHAPTAVTYHPLGPWMVPSHLGSEEAEYLALTMGAAVLDYSIFSQIAVTGADAADFLHRILTNGIRGLRSGQGCRAALLNANGMMLAEILVLRDTDAFRLLVEAERAPAVLAALDKYLFSEAVTLVNRERCDAVAAIQGPETFAIARTLFGIDLSGAGAMSHGPAEFGGIPLRWIVHGIAGRPGILCLADAHAAAALWNRLCAHGTALVPAGWDALNTARIEAGVPWYGVDADETNLLPETGLDEDLISERKGCYVGQEIVARMRTYGSANKKLMRLIVEGAQVPESGCRIQFGQDDAGWVTSACLSPATGRAVALGYVKRPHYAPQTPVRILRAAGTIAATVAPLLLTRQSSAQ